MAQDRRTDRAYKVRGWIAALVFVGIVGAVGWGIAASQHDDPSPAQQLLTFDGGRATAPLSDYESMLRIVEPKCSNSTDALVQLVERSGNDLRENNINDETSFTLLRHLYQSIPAGTTMDCQGVLAAYLVLREG